MKLRSQPVAPKGVKYALTGPQSVFFAELSLRGSLRAPIKTVLGIDYQPAYIRIDAGGAMSWNYDTDQSFINALMKHVASPEDAIANFTDGMEATARLLDRESRLLAAPEHRHNDSAADIYADLKRLWYAYELQMATLFTFWNIEIFLSQLLTDRLLEHNLKSEVDNGLIRFLKPYQPNYFIYERHELAEIAKRFGNLKNNSAELREAVRHHGNYFGFLLTPYNLGEPPAIKDQLKRLKELTEADETAGVLYEADSFKDLPVDLVRLAKLAQKFSFWKSERVDIMALADYRVKPLYEQAAKLLGVSLTDFVTMTRAEILASLKAGQLHITDAQLRARRRRHCLVLNKDTIDFYEPFLQTNSGLDSKAKVLRGIGASTGKARGRVRILPSTDKGKTVQPGEIIVTPMTRPEMGSALDRAVGFVTDEGGLLCHAAIISREMKKPCVIATGNATKALSTGDLVEVDGNKGEVRIIEHKEGGK